jgi:hypothetical protein
MTTTTATDIKQTYTVEGKTFDTLLEAEVYALQQQRLQEAIEVLTTVLPKPDPRTLRTSETFDAERLARFLQEHPDACRQPLEILHPCFPCLRRSEPAD